MNNCTDIMGGRILALDALSGKATQRVPVALFTWEFDYYWKAAGLQPWQLIGAGHNQWHNAHIALWEKHKQDLLWYSGAGSGPKDCTLVDESPESWFVRDNNTGIEYELIKSSLTCRERESGSKGCDSVGVIESAADVDRLIPEFHGWGDSYLSGLRRLIDTQGDRALVLPHHSPAYICACYALGFERAMDAMLSEPDLFTYVCDRYAAGDMLRMRELAEAGAEAVFIADGWASCDIISPAMFDRFALPYQKSITEAAHCAGLKIILWNEGDIIPILDREAALDVDAFAFEQPRKGIELTVSKVREAFGPDRCLFGNVDSEELLKRNNPADIRHAVQDQIRMSGEDSPFILSTGSPIPSDVEIDAVDAMIAAARCAADNKRHSVWPANVAAERQEKQVGKGVVDADKTGGMIASDSSGKMLHQYAVVFQGFYGLGQNGQIKSDIRMGMILPDGTGEYYPEFPVPNQACWQLGMIFEDGRRAVVWSQEPPRNPNASFYDKDGRGVAKSHLWLYDFADGTPRELNLPDQHGVVGELPGGRLLVGGNLDGTTRLFTCGSDGGAREEIFTGPGFAYCTSLSPDGTRVAFHITGVPGRPGYEIYVLDLSSKKRVLIASDDNYFHFGPGWSPDGKWLLYQRCAHREDPGHDRSDLCLSRADGSEHRVLTSGQSHWFAAAMGTPDRHGGGSNLAAWSPDGKRIACALLLPGSRTAWPYAQDRPDTDHFNRDYYPELARGGTQVCLIDVETGKITPITHDDPPTWHCDISWSPDGSQLAFARADVGFLPELWVMDAGGGNQRRLTRGPGGIGVRYPRWLRFEAVCSWMNLNGKQ